MRETIRFRKIGKHKNGCVSMREYRAGRWNTPWGTLAYGPSWSKLRDIVPTHYQKRGVGSGVWLRFSCNDPDCMAVLMIHEEELLVLAAKRAYA